MEVECYSTDKCSKTTIYLLSHVVAEPPTTLFKTLRGGRGNAESCPINIVQRTWPIYANSLASAMLAPSRANKILLIHTISQTAFRKSALQHFTFADEFRAPKQISLKEILLAAATVSNPSRHFLRQRLGLERRRNPHNFSYAETASTPDLAQKRRVSASRVQLSYCFQR